MKTATRTAPKAAQFSDRYVPAGTQMFVRKIGTRGKWIEHRNISGVIVPNGTNFTREEQFLSPYSAYGETEYVQFQSMGFEVIVKESAITFDVIEPAAHGEGYCPKCDGTGVIEAFRNVANGVCFWCKGKGK